MAKAPGPFPLTIAIRAAERYRKEAQRLHTLADNHKSAEVREILLELVAQYDRLAKLDSAATNWKTDD